MNLIENSSCLTKQAKLIKESQKDFDELSLKSSNELLDEWEDMQYLEDSFSNFELRISWLIETILISRGWLKKLIKRSQKFERKIQKHIEEQYTDPFPDLEPGEGL